MVGPRLARAALTRFERLLPVSRDLVRYLRERAPDVVVLTSLTYSRSQQLDVLRAARALDIPVVAAIMSWDHLSSKGLLHIAPDKVFVWNQVQMHEAITMHGLPGDRIVATGAQCYDQWFTKAPSRGRDEFCRAMGLRADRPFALWVHSALSPTPDPPEPVLVTRWIEALRASANPALRELGVLVRPHPERLKEWAGIDLGRFENVAFHGGNPIDGRSRDDYFDSLYHSGAVVGLVTSAFLEAGDRGPAGADLHAARVRDAPGGDDPLPLPPDGGRGPAAHGGRHGRAPHAAGRRGGQAGRARREEPALPGSVRAAARPGRAGDTGFRRCAGGGAALRRRRWRGCRRRGLPAADRRGDWLAGREPAWAGG